MIRISCCRSHLLCWTSLLMFAVTVDAAPLSTPFLSVDVNGGQGSFGPTEDDPSRWSGWDINQGTFGFGTSTSQSFSSPEGTVNATLDTVGAGRDARDRGDGNPDEGVPNNDVLRDFVFISKDSADALGRNFFELTLSGLQAGEQYELTLHHFDPFSSTDNYIAIGLENPAEWLDTNVGMGDSYQPSVGGVNNPIPTLARNLFGGPWPSDPGLGIPFSEAEYFYSTTIVVEADGSGSLTAYGWADQETYSGNSQLVVLSGFEIGLAIPEPTTLALATLVTVGLIARRRR